MWSSSEVALKRALLLTLCLLQLARGSPKVNSGVSNYSFPDDFMFGVGTAAFSIEGGWNEGGKGESIWDTYIHGHPEYTDDHKNADVAADSYHRYMEDIEMIKSLGVQAYRMSISWSRILPNGTNNNINQEGVKYYRTIFEELQKANITPAVTMFHWDMPTQFMYLGGWTNAKTIDYFEDYARILFNLYGDIVKLWLTINEPHHYCRSIGMVAHPIFSEEGDYPSLVREIINKISSQQGFPRSLLPYFADEEVKALRGSADFFSLNHYSTNIISKSETEPTLNLDPPLSAGIGIKLETDPSWPVPGPEWLAVYPPGFRKVLNWLQNNYKILKKIPIYVTENGLCDYGTEGTEDYQRVSYINDYLNQVLLAIHEDGVNVKGYFAWSLMDDFQWTEGHTLKFGLFSVDFDSPNRTRTPKLSAYNYANIARTRRIDFDYSKRSESLYTTT